MQIPEKSLTRLREWHLMGLGARAVMAAVEQKVKEGEAMFLGEYASLCAALGVDPEQYQLDFDTGTLKPKEPAQE